MDLRITAKEPHPYYNDDCSGKIISSLQICAFQVEFRPTIEGPLAATISVPSNDPDTPNLDVLLSGTGIILPYPLTVTKAGTGIGTVVSSPPGIICGNDCTEEYPSGTTVILTATA